MPTVFDVPADLLIKRLAEYLKENVNEVTPPAWASFAKTGVHMERPSQKVDWWYIRCASILRKIYVEEPVGISKLRLAYGGRVGQRHGPEHFRRGSGAIIRKVVQQLEAAGLVKKANKKGRAVTREGRSLLDRFAGEVKKELEKRLPELKKY